MPFKLNQSYFNHLIVKRLSQVS